jgi:hypothetical protein
MQIEPIHQLAVTLHTSPRLYACVLGSGVSRSAGVPTGWEVLLDLTRTHAGLLDESEAAVADPALWFKRRYGHEPDYSDIVNALAPTSALRRNLLEQYFTVLDPATGERNEHQPTPAHRAIARLVKLGLLRVIVTTNFDRLMEIALRDAGVARTEVISLAEEAANCYPFHASEAFVFKIHGDWRDLGLRNSRDELASYPDPIAALLRRILDEHALIVCGWSAEYDVALREAVRTFHRRFPVYWVDPRRGEHAQQLCSSLQATYVSATADTFFQALEPAVTVLQRSGPPERLTGRVLVLRAQRAIETKRDIEIETLVSDATRALVSWIDARKEEFPENEADLAAQLASAERASEPLCRLTAALAHYGTDARLISLALSRLLGAASRKNTLEIERPIAAYPAVLLAFTWGIGAAARTGWEPAIRPLCDAGSGESFAELVVPPGSNERLFYYGGAGKYAPVAIWGEHMADVVYGFSEEWFARRSEFDSLFDRFDLLVSIRSARLGEWWIPRCMVQTDVAGKFSRWNEPFEEWFVPTIERGDGNPLNRVLLGIDKRWPDLVDELRNLARTQQERWQP